MWLFLNLNKVFVNITNCTLSLTAFCAVNHRCARTTGAAAWWQLNHILGSYKRLVYIQKYPRGGQDAVLVQLLDNLCRCKRNVFLIHSRNLWLFYWAQPTSLRSVHQHTLDMFGNFPDISWYNIGKKNVNFHR